MHIVIIGGSVAANTCAIHLRQKSKDCAVTLISEEAFPFYERRKLFDYWQGTVKEKQLFIGGAEFYAQQDITFLKGSKAVAINPNRKTVSYKQDDKRSSVEYDILVIASGRKTVFPDIPGINKTGVYRLDSLADFKELKNAVTQDAVCLIGKNHLTDKVIACLAAFGVEIKLAFAGTVENPPAHVEILASDIVDIIGESGVQAIKLKEGKIIGVSWVAVMQEPVPSIDFLEGAHIALENGCIAVNEAMRTSLIEVFACGSVCQRTDEPPKIKSWDESENEGLLVAENILKV